MSSAAVSGMVLKRLISNSVCASGDGAGGHRGPDALVAVIGDCGACSNSKTALGVVSIAADTTASVKNQNNSKTQTSSGFTGQINTLRSHDHSLLPISELE